MNDWFGVCGGNIAILERKYINLIVDNAQSFYAVPKGIGSFYSPRKFFGLPDGGLLISDKMLELKLTKDVSYERTAHLLKRYDLGASAGYDDFRVNDDLLLNQPIMEMSNLTRALMGNIDYGRVRQVRLENFHHLHNEFSSINELVFDLDTIACPMVYPLLAKKTCGKNSKRLEYMSRVIGMIAAILCQKRHSLPICRNSFFLCRLTNAIERKIWTE